MRSSLRGFFSILLIIIAAQPAAAACRTHYFSSVQQSVGTGSAQRTSDLEPSLAAFRLGPLSVGTSWLEVARFYSPVLSANGNVVLETHNDGKPSIVLYVDNIGSSPLQGRVRLHDFNPATGQTRVIGDAVTSVVAGNTPSAMHSVTSMPIAAGTTIAPGHRLMWTVSYVSANETNDILFRYGGGASPAFARVCGTEKR